MKNGKLILFFVLTLTACHEKSNEAEKEKILSLSEKEQIERGKYLVTIGGCNDCHSTKKMTPQGPVPDEKTLLAGHPQDEKLPPADGTTAPGWVLFNMSATAYYGPWGAFFAANLTPHETGIGNWDYKQFETAMREGKYKGLKTGRMLLPPMPWTNYKDMKDEDLRAIFAYLKSIPPVNNLVPAPIPPKELSGNKN